MHKQFFECRPSAGEATLSQSARAIWGNIQSNKAFLKFKGGFAGGDALQSIFETTRAVTRRPLLNMYSCMNIIFDESLINMGSPTRRAPLPWRRCLRRNILIGSRSSFDWLALRARSQSINSTRKALILIGSRSSFGRAKYAILKLCNLIGREQGQY